MPQQEAELLLTLLSSARAAPAPPGPGAGAARTGRCALRQRHLAAPREGGRGPARPPLRRRGGREGTAGAPCPRPQTVPQHWGWAPHYDCRLRTWLKLAWLSG